MPLRTLRLGARAWHPRPRGMTTHRGSCHCGRVRFEVDLELDHVRSCDCSICRRRGALIHRVPADRLRMLTPLSDLTLYQWHTRTADEIAAGHPDFTGWGVNVRCLEGVDLDAIPVRRVYGSRLA